MAAGDGGIGAVSRMVWKSLLPYRVEFEVTTTHVERPYLLQADAVGELAGIGRWRLYEHDGVTVGPLRVERGDDEAVDEPARADRSPRLRVEPRLGDVPRRHRHRQLARLQVARQRLGGTLRRTAIFTTLGTHLCRVPAPGDRRDGSEARFSRL